MKKSLKIVSLILAALFLISGTMLIAFAEGEEIGGGETPGGEIGGGETPGGEIGGGETPGGEIGGGDNPGGEIGGGEIGGGEVGGGEVGGGEIGGGEIGGGEIGGGEIGGGSSYVAPQQNYDPIYFGDASNNNYNYAEDGETAGSVSANNTLYNSSGISAAEAAPNQWSEITLDEKTVKTQTADFSSIKSNTETTDNGQWILYLGYVLLGLAALGILYFIIATVAQRKAYVNEAAIHAQREASTPARSQAARMSEREAAAQKAQKSVSRYNDEIKAYNRRVSSKADTGEIYVPRRAKTK